MKKGLKIVSAVLTCLLMFSACQRVPITKRRQLNLVPENQLIEIAKVQYAEFLSTAKVLPESDPRSKMVTRVGNNIKDNVEAFLKKEHASKRVEGFEWEFKVVDDPTVNAWCMPGGKVVVYTGILELATDDDLLATVMGHEIAHAIARHGNERYSKGIAVQVGGEVIGASAKSDLFKQSYGLATTLGMLKYSRKNESESDKLGLVFMALAGYKAEKAVDFWQKMSALGGQKPPQILSTHPSDETRIADIKAFLPEISKYLN